MFAELLPWEQLIAACVAAVVAVAGFVATHWLTSRRDLYNEKRRIQINFMIEAYRKLESSSCRGSDRDRYSDQFESAVADVQLLGSPYQVEVARRIALEVGSGSGELVRINDLLNVLRNGLRAELGLLDVGPEIVILRNPEQISSSKGD